MATKNVLVLGTNSGIGEATARIWAERGYGLYLVGRNLDALDASAKDLRVRGAKILGTKVLDLSDISNHTMFMADVLEATQNRIDIAALFYGILGDAENSKSDIQEVERILQVNFVSAASLLTLIACQMEKQKSGTIVAVSSVAGDRGRQSNYVYGSSKAGLNIFLQGLRNRLFSSGVRVLTIKPGFVDTPMTKNFKKGLLWAQPSQVARGIVRGADLGLYSLYLPTFWALIMFVIRIIPERIFVRLKL